jgi:hypothetical protein
MGVEILILLLGVMCKLIIYFQARALKPFGMLVFVDKYDLVHMTLCGTSPYARRCIERDCFLCGVGILKSQLIVDDNKVHKRWNSVQTISCRCVHFCELCFMQALRYIAGKCQSRKSSTHLSWKLCWNNIYASLVNQSGSF